MAHQTDLTYHFKHYRRTKPGGTAGELVKTVEIKAPGPAQAEQIAAKDYLVRLDFRTDFAALEGDSGFVSFWLTGHKQA